MQNKFFALLVGFLILALIFCGIKACNEVTPEFHYSNPSTVDDPLSLENVLRKKEKQYAHSMWLMERSNDSLCKIAETHQLLLSQSQKHVATLENRTLSLWRKFKTSHNAIEKLNTCDSLQNETLDLITQQAEKDSLYQASINDLNCLVENKDAELLLCQSSHNELSQNISDRLTSEKQVQEELKKCEKEIARKSTAQKILTAGLLILSGITAALLIH